MTPQQHKFTEAREARSFVLSGKAIFTLKSLASGKHYTYKVKLAPDGGVSFVSLCTGDNEFGYTYIGLLRAGRYSHGARSPIQGGSLPAQAISWALRNVFELDRIPQGLEIWHEGRCGACARLLTDPTSIARGLGPECAQRRAA